MRARRSTAGIGVATALLLLGALLPSAASAQFDAFLLLDGIPGESQDRDHPEWIEVTGFATGGRFESTGGVGGGGAVRFSPIKVLKEIDSASPALRTRAADGSPIPIVVLELVRPDAARPVFYRIELEQAVISESSTVSASETTFEILTFDFRTIRWIYTELAPDGTPRGTIEAGWDLAANAPL